MVGAGRRKSRLPRKILRVILSDGSCQLQTQINDLKQEEEHSIVDEKYSQKQESNGHKSKIEHNSHIIRHENNQYQENSPPYKTDYQHEDVYNDRYNGYEKHSQKPYNDSENRYYNLNSNYRDEQPLQKYKRYSPKQQVHTEKTKKSSSNKQDLSPRASYKHQHPEPTPEFPYQCETCDMLFKAMDLLLDHQTTVHENNRQFSCRYCSKRFNDKYNMRKHVLIHVGEKRHKCQFCEKAFLRKDHLRSHLQTHYNRKYGCKFCGKGFRTMELYQRHLKTHKEEVKNNPELLQPDICESIQEVSRRENGDASPSTSNSRSVTSSPTLKEEEIPTIKEDEVAVTILDDDFDMSNPWSQSSPSISENEMSFTGSPLCDDTARNSTVPENGAYQNTSTDFQCTLCKKDFINEDSLQKHERSCGSSKEKSKKSFQCTQCSIVFDESATLKQHYEKVHSLDKGIQSPSRWRCKSCDINYPNSKELSRHYAQAHKDAQIFPCSECPKTFTVWHNLKKHMLIHLGDKKHKCTVCEKGFVRKDHLNSHMKVHLGEGSKFMCTICNKVFRLKQMYFKHMNLHGLEQAYTMVDK